jgi:hypothetical protein
MALKRESAKLVRGYEQSGVRSDGETGAQHSTAQRCVRSDGGMAHNRKQRKTPLCVKMMLKTFTIQNN